MSPVFPNFEELIANLGVSPTVFWALVVLTALWVVAAKGYALWHAARNSQRYWFIALLIINTFGILEIIYVAWFRKDKQEGYTQPLFNSPGGPVSTAT